MKVFFEELTNSQRAGGIEAVTRELILHLDAIGVEVTRSSEREPHGAPDCVHLHGIWSPKLAIRFSTWVQRGVPCIVTLHGMLEPWALKHKRTKKWIAWHMYQRGLLNRAALLHGTSEREVQQLLGLGLTPPAVMLPWGVSLSPIRILQSDKSRTRTALFVGRIYPVKGLPLLVEAWGKVRPSGWKLKIVGPDEAGHRAEVEASIKKAGIGKFVEFTGELIGSEKDAAYANADLFVLPSFTENFGMAVAEALAHSLPVLTTTGTPWGALSDWSCGWWVAPTTDTIAAGLAAATNLEDKVLHDMGARGRQLVASQYTWQQTAARMKKAYQSMVAKFENKY